MGFESSIKNFSRSAGRNLIVALRWFIRRMPYRVFSVLCAPLMILSWPILYKKRKIARKSLEIAFKNEKTPEELKQIANQCFKVFGRGMVDLIYYIDHTEDVKANIRMEGVEHLEAARRQGKGAILVSAHFGYFILMYRRLVLAGYPTNVIMKRVRDAKFEEYISEFRNQQGVKTIYDLPSRQCVANSIRALRNNEVLIILLDQNFGGDGRVFVDFFGHPAATATGPVVFAQRTGAPILPMFIMHETAQKHKIVIEPPVDLKPAEDNEAFIQQNVAQLSKIIEARIRQNPGEWGGWMHKRWKTRTVEEQRAIDREREMGIKKSRLFDYENI